MPSFSLTAALFVVFLLCLVRAESYVVGKTRSYPTRKVKATQVHFFLQDVVVGKNQTAFRVARANRSSAGAFPFSDVFVFDDPMTETADPKSRAVGNAQGLYAFTGIDRMSVFLSADFAFTSGRYNGSSFTVASRNPITEPRRELAVVGGRGKFRLARGYAVLTTSSFRGLAATVEYNVTILHH